MLTQRITLIHRAAGGPVHMLINRPYIGAEYGHGTRIWQLAESHYGHPHEQHEDYTVNTLEYWTQVAPERARAHGLFRRTARLLRGLSVGARLLDADYSALYRRVAFSNLVQGFPGPSPRVRPSKALWGTGKRAFEISLACIDPEVILVIGRATWDHMPPPISASLIDLPTGARAPLRWYAVAGRPVPAMYINHTASFGWRYNRWLPVVTELFARAAR